MTEASGSARRRREATITLRAAEPGTALTTGDGKDYYSVPAEFDGWIIIAVQGHVFGPSSSGNPTFQIHNETAAADILSTALTIDATELDSKDATTPAVIDTAEDALTEGDEIRLDCDVAGTGTTGGDVTLTIREP